MPGYAAVDQAGASPRFAYSSTEPERVCPAACKGAAVFVLGKLKTFGLVLAFVNIMFFNLLF